jgi:hypothetical protein
MLRRLPATAALATTTVVLIAGCSGPAVSHAPPKARIVAASTTANQVHTVTAERPDRAEPAEAEPTLGAGDSLGRAVFNQYADNLDASDQRQADRSPAGNQTSNKAASTTSGKPKAATDDPTPAASADPILHFLRELNLDRDRPKAQREAWSVADAGQ